MTDPCVLPEGVVVFERGWLSSNNVLFVGQHTCALVDTGYSTNADQTLALVKSRLGARALDVLANTHLHSDHCGGNAALQRAFPLVRTLIPPGQAEHVARWDSNALSYAPTGQHCPRFVFDDLLRPGTELELGDRRWQVHAARGHDPHSIILFEPQSRTLLSADALWENGFGVVFPELEGTSAFDEVADTLDLIESLGPATVIPGHGRVFSDARTALGIARKRLNGFVSDPQRHGTYAAKALMMFKLLEVHEWEMEALISWTCRTPYFMSMHQSLAQNLKPEAWAASVADSLVSAKAARRVGSRIIVA